MNVVLTNELFDMNGFVKEGSYDGYSLYVNHSIVSNNIQFKIIENAIRILIGRIYDRNNKSIDCVYSEYKRKGLEGLLSIDGDFVYIEASKKEIRCISSREGIIPIYYYEHGSFFSIGSDCRSLLKISHFCIDDVDDASVNDFLRFGTLISNETFSRKVKLLEGGSELVRDLNGIRIDRLYAFRYKPESISDDDLMDEILQSYRDGIKKRTPDLNGVSLFLSGGMDSRFALHAFNCISPGRVQAICFSQDNSDELATARQCAAIQNNPFKWIATNATNFVENADEYLRLVCGTDMFPQSYIICALKGLDIKAYYTGWALGALLGGTFFPDNVDQKGTLADVISAMRKPLKLNCMSDDMLSGLLLDDKRSFFLDIGINNLIRAAACYSEDKIENVIDAFDIEIRSKRLVLNRMIVPSLDATYYEATVDRDFLNAVAKIGAERRQKHRFYRNLMTKRMGEYADIVYNNTTVPVSAELSLWDEGKAIEAQKEKLHYKVYEEWNACRKDKCYYKHYYSDFESYSRYDSSWVNLFKRTLGNVNNPIYQKWLKYDKVSELLENHLSGKQNNRKALCYLASLALYMDMVEKGTY